MELRWLGSTGVRVSTFALGTMGFGGAARGGWVASIDQTEADRQVGTALDAGVNVVDSADSYGNGEAEVLLGRALRGRRDDVIVSTKVHSRSGPGPNDVGQSRWHLVRACEASLRRLATDHIDLYHVHGFDGCTPLEETLEGLNDLVRSGKVRYLACSNLAAWQAMKALGIARAQGWSRFVAYQGYWSLVGRDIEHEIAPMCRDQQLGVLVWSPLAGGFLTGKSSPGVPAPDGTRRSYVGDLGVGRIDETRGYAIVDVLREIAAARGVSVAQVALNWVRSRPEVSSVVVGARTTEQLTDNLAAASWALDPAERERLDRASAVEHPYPVWFQRQFTAERFSPAGPPADAFDYDFGGERAAR
jgi:aryl-alcohol dehydrogenase-like predicted oxidoreductase